jgi:uncharacterized repeat protein (TIGR03803 family)
MAKTWRNKRGLFKLRLTLAISGGLNLALTGFADAQALTSLHRFSPLSGLFENNDGAYPASDLILTAGVLYGTASQGGIAGGGTVFKVNADGTGFKILHSFSPPNQNTGDPGDGAFPLGGLVLAQGTLYGTTFAGGTGNAGTLFKVNTDGTGFAIVYTFSAADPTTGANSDGAAPWAGLLLSGSTLYGTATGGGDAGVGTAFKINTDGSGFSRLHSFAAVDTSTLTNNDGSHPLGGLILSGSTLYGTAFQGGGLGSGVVFKVNADGSSFAVLSSLSGGPRGRLVVTNNTLYGTTENGGDLGYGSVFRLNTDGSELTNLFSFAADTADGPWAGLVLSGKTLYGTTLRGGAFSQGSLFSINTDGSGFTNRYSFTDGTDGAQPQAGVVLSGDILYGTASEGGDAADGTVFSLSPGIVGGQQLTITSSGGNVVFMWPVNGLRLQATTNLVPPVVWTAVSPGPAIVNGQNAVTNTVSVVQRFYELTQ